MRQVQRLNQDNLLVPGVKPHHSVGGVWFLVIGVDGHLDCFRIWAYPSAQNDKEWEIKRLLERYLNWLHLIVKT